MPKVKAPDWLPAGWTAHRKRKNERNYVCYIDPSNELKFYSKPEVLRHLKKEQENSYQKSNEKKGTSEEQQISCQKSNEKKGTSEEQEISYQKSDEKKGTSEEQEISCQKSNEKKGTSEEQESSCQKSNEKKGTSGSKHVENVLVEKTVPEELPPGWTKELRVKKKGGKIIRKDPYYTDPVTGYVFRSLKDVNRYLKTGVLGKLASKPKDDNRVDMELDNEKTDSAAEGEKSADEGTNGQITACQISKLVETGNDELPLESTDTANAVCIAKNASEPCKENVAVGNVNIPEASGLDATREENTENELKEKQAVQDKKKKSSEKSKPGLPRRASKRLAGAEVDLPREPKTRRQAAARRASEVITSSTCLASSAESETKVTTEKSSNEKQVNSDVLPLAKNLPNLGKHAEEIEMDSNQKERQDGNVEMDNKPKERQDGNAEADKKANAKQQLPIVLPPPILSTEEHNGEVVTNSMPMEGQEPPSQLPAMNIITSEEHGVAELVVNNIPKEKLELPNDLPPASLSTSTEDHGKKVEQDNNDKSCVKQELSNVFPLADLLIPGEHPGSMVTDNKADIKPESPVNLSLTDLWTDPCIEFAVKTLTGAIPVGEENKVETYSGSPLDMPLGELWTDPCIEFAVKTLTGAIPVGEDLNVQQYFQQHACSSENQGENNGLTLPDVGVTNFCQTQFVSQQFNTAENSRNKQQEFGGVPMLPNHINGSLQPPSSTGPNQRVKGNNGECSRQTFF